MNLSQSGPWIGFTGLAVLLWIYVFSGLFAPWWVVLGLVAVWLVLLVLAIGWTRPRPRTVAVLPFVGSRCGSASCGWGDTRLDWG